MVTESNRDDLQFYRDQIRGLNQPETKTAPVRSLNLFFSFDIVNSTAYKDIDYLHWPAVTIKLFESIQGDVIKYIQNAQVWKSIGDELVFVVPINSEEQIFSYIDSVFHILHEKSSSLRRGDFFDTVFDEGTNENEAELAKYLSIISLKAAAWLAIINDDVKVPEPFDCFRVSYMLPSNRELIDFIGNDIDAGFRIKQQTVERRLTVSFELAYILAKESQYLSKLHIVTYKRLKGIWQNHYYPIIWFYDVRDSGESSFDESFYYDEIENNDLVKEYFENKHHPLLADHRLYDDILYALEKIKCDNGIDKKIAIMRAAINDSHQTVLMEPQYKLYLHCVAVCCDFSKKRILVMKRTGSRKYLAGKWEFGCAKATLQDSLKERIEKEYKDDFGFNIEVIIDKDRQEDPQPMPLALYEVAREQGTDKGIITIARISNPDSVDLTRKCTKHDQMAWITKDGIESFAEDAVSDFKSTLKRAFDVMDQFAE